MERLEGGGTSGARACPVSHVMMRTLSSIAVAFTLLAACGGTEPSPKQPDPGAGTAAPASPAAPATPGSATPGGTVQGSSCSVTQKNVDSHLEYDENCNGRVRQCTLEAGDSAWSCMCTASSGAKSSCQAQPARSDVVTPPPDCCPAG